MARLKRVLHVDDEEDIRTIAKLALEVVGDFVVLQCSSGVQAIDEVASFSPDLFLLDYMMPNLDGEATYQKLCEIPGMENVPVVFMTARADSKISKRLLDSGALEVVAKPFDPMTLASLLHEIWDNASN